MKARIVWIVIALAVLGVVVVRVKEARARAGQSVTAPDRAQLVRTARVLRAPMEDTVIFTGSIKARNEVDVFAKLGGRIESLNVQVGDAVKAGQVLATIEHKEIAWQAKAAEAALAVARANLAAAKLDHDRTETLFKGGSAPRAQLDGAQARQSLAEAQVAQAEAAAGLARQQVANARIEAPIDGTVTRRMANQGGMAGPSSPMFTIQDVATLKLDSAVDPGAYGRLRRGAPAVIRVDALPGQTFTGAVKLIAPALDAITRRAAVELEIDNTSGKLLPNMFAAAHVMVGKVEDALVVPKEAVLLSAGGARVFKVVEGNKVQSAEAALGATDGVRYHVLSGVKEGDRVIVGGLGGLADGIEVKPTAEPPADGPLSSRN